jgi:hypothetical protein
VKRGGPLQRKTPLRAKPPTPAERHAKQQAAADRARARQAERAREPLAKPRKVAPAKRTAPRVAPAKPDPVTAAVRAEVAERSRGLCEARVSPRCHGTAQHVHHRKLRRHGDHSAENLLHVCHACHDAIHSSWYAATAYARHFLLRSHEDPEEYPVRHAA